MKNKILYIEQSTGANHNGQAWIATVQYSKTGKTIYFNGLSLASSKGSGNGANYFDIVSSNEYWVSGVKTQEINRHWAGNGIIQVEESVLYWLKNHVSYDITKYIKVISDLPKTNIKMQNLIENPKIE